MYPDQPECVLTAAQARLTRRLLAVMDIDTATAMIETLELLATLTNYGAVHIRRDAGHYRFIDYTVSNDTHR